MDGLLGVGSFLIVIIGDYGSFPKIPYVHKKNGSPLELQWRIPFPSTWNSPSMAPSHWIHDIPWPSHSWSSWMMENSPRKKWFHFIGNWGPHWKKPIPIFCAYWNHPQKQVIYQLDPTTSITWCCDFAASLRHSCGISDVSILPLGQRLRNIWGSQATDHTLRKFVAMEAMAHLCRWFTS